MRTLAILLVLTVPLAGCLAHAPSSQDSASPTPTVATTLSGGPGKAAPKTTDTLWLGKDGKMSTRFEDKLQPDQTPLDTSGIPTPQGGLAFWNFTLSGSGGLAAANATVWFRVPPDTVRWSYNPNNPTCPWGLLVGIQHAGSTHLYGMECPASDDVLEGGGDVAVNFTLQGADPLPFVPGDLLTLEVSATGFVPPPNQPITVLSGARPFESKVQVEGLQEIVQQLAGTLLLAT